MVIDGDRLYVQFTSPRDSFLKMLEFSTKNCSIENTLDLRTIDLQLSRNLDFRRNFFSPFDGTGKVYELLPQCEEVIKSAKYRSISLTN